MTGTAAEVTPVRAVDDHEIGVGPVTLRAPEGVPRHGPRPRRALEPLARRASRRRRRRAEACRATARHDRPLSSPWLDEREEELVARGAPLGAALARPDDRPLRGGVRRARSARRTPPRSRAARPACTCSASTGRRRAPATRSITSPYSFVASANCFIYEGATPVFADIDPRTLNLDPAAVEAAITRADEGDRRGRHLRLPVRARRAASDRASGTGSRSSRTRARRSGAEYKGGRVGSHGRRRGLRLLPEQADHDGRGRRSSTTHSEEEWRLAREPAQPGPRRRRRLARRTRGSASTTGSTTSAAALGIAPAREARRDPRAAREVAAARYARAARATSTGSSCRCADDADHERSWFVYVVTLARGHRPRAA